ncbi:AfsA-related hotdog domain-containing protein [Kitasatospora sp. MMS16-BH015]|uniref:AfsA-related hotdog domain-containing protein n=1 Tax=Kitasatospora sp. MMS16-BH015 TaxID=2018025 RepID=UPI00131A4CD9|nr:AfsA-related hotdog domain-containing protein [Kitasatospora sp. MMS16-BH015]
MHHLVHRPNTPEGVVLGTTGPTEQQFAVSALLPERHPLFNDGAELFHDLHSPAEVLRRTALFVSHRYFRVPQERPAVFAATEVAMTGLEPWRRSPGPAHLAMDITLTPADVVSGVPRGLECESTIYVEGARCGTASARLVFLMPRVYQNHRERGRSMSRAEFIGPTDGELWAGSPTARAVGRADQVNVVLGTPLLSPESELVVELVTDPRNQVYAEATTDHVPALVLIEGTRQAALLLAGELHGFTVGSCVLSRWNARFQGFAEPDLPLYCRATAGELERTADGRPALPVALTLHQGSRQVAAIDTVVLQDC